MFGFRTDLLEILRPKRLKSKLSEIGWPKSLVFGALLYVFRFTMYRLNVHLASKTSEKKHQLNLMYCNKSHDYSRAPKSERVLISDHQ